MKSVPEVAQCLRRRDDNQARHFSLPHNPLHRGGDHPCEPVLFDVVPVDRLDRASLTGEGFAHASRRLTSLLVRRRVDILEYALDLQVEIKFVALIPQEQRLAPIAYKYKGIVRDLWFAHLSLQL